MLAFPSVIPSPSLTYSGKVVEPVARTQSLPGLLKQRQRFTTELRTYIAQWEFTDFEFAMFQGFVFNKLNNGADKFTVTAAVGGSLKTITAQFVDGSFSYSILNGTLNWSVKATLETRDAVGMSEADFNTATSWDSMAPLAWPVLLPAPTITFGGKNETPTVGIQMASNRFRRYRKFTTELRTHSIEWSMTDEQYELFQAFVLYKLANGTNFFNIDLPNGDSFQTVQARIVNGEADPVMDATFQWHVKASLEVQDMAVLSGETYDFFLTGDTIENIEDATGELDHMVNTELHASSWGNL
jgi:hypothetical protein